MNTKYVMRIDIINMILRFMVGFTIIGMIGLLYTNNAAYVWKSLILFQATVISFLINRFSKHIWVYLLLHFVMIAVYLLLTDHMILRVLYILYITFYAMFQFGEDLDKKQGNTPLPFVIVLFIMYLVCKYNYPKEFMLNRFFFFLAITFVLIYVVNRHQINVCQYLAKHEEKVNIPLKQINQSNTIFITVFIVLCSAVMMLLTKLPIERLLYYLWLIIRNLLRALVSGLTKQPKAIPIEEESILPNEYITELEGLEIQVSEPSAFWQGVMNIIVIISGAIFIVLVISLITYGLYKIYKKYYQTKTQVNEKEKIEVISPFDKIDLKFLGGRKSLKDNLLNLFGRSNNDKIRKQFVKAIKKNTKSDKDLKYHTPTELSKYAVMTDKRKEGALTTLYEKARYSNAECSNEEVQSVKNILK